MNRKTEVKILKLIVEVRRMKIAIVDDVAKDLSIEIDYLTTYISKNFPTLSTDLAPFQDPEKFLENFESNRFDLVILDIIMESMNGIQLAQKIREIDRDCSIIFVTSSEDFLIDGYSVFASGYLLKPIEPHILLDKVEEVFKKKG